MVDPTGLDRGIALRGSVWTGGDPVRVDFRDGVVVVGPDGRVVAVGPFAEVAIPMGLPTIGGPGHWVLPGVVDAHVHLAFGPVSGAVVGARDLGAPPGDRPDGCCAAAGQIITAPGGYPSTTWGRYGFARGVDNAAAARYLVADLIEDGVELVKIAIEPAGGLPTPTPEVVRAVVGAAHDAGLPVTAHALAAEAVLRALDAGVDELAHTPTEPLDATLLDAIAAAGIPVISTLQTFCAGGQGRGPIVNAKALHERGVRLVYGTDLGNGGTQPGVDPRELDRLAEAGLRREGALLSAVSAGRYAVGLGGAPNGRIEVGARAAVVLLPGSPLEEPSLWRAPTAIIRNGVLTT